MPSVINDDSTVEPSLGVCIIESYDHYNNFFQQISKIQKLQRVYKNFMKLKKEKLTAKIKEKEIHFKEENNQIIQIDAEKKVSYN
jgi:hypothetical protein